MDQPAETHICVTLKTINNVEMESANGPRTEEVAAATMSVPQIIASRAFAKPRTLVTVLLCSAE